MSNNITIVELAEALGLSKSTVSRAFRDSNDISAKTKDRILQKAKEMGFSPNLHASNLRVNKSNTIAIVIPEFGNKFFSQAIKGIELIARTKGYHVLIYVTDHSAEKEGDIVRSLINGRVDGVIMSASGEGKGHDYLSLLEQHQLPIVFFDRFYDDVNTVCITGDDHISSRSATQHLIENNCKRIAYLAINKDVSIGKIRMEGYMEALKTNGIPVEDELILDTSNDAEVNAKDIRNLIEKYRPDAVFASVERLAISTIRVANELKMSIPEDLKLICFSCLDTADLLSPPLSVVKQPAYEMGMKATEYLLDFIHGEGHRLEKKIVYLESSLIYQTSSQKKIKI